MTVRHLRPSPLAGEGAERRRREAGEGARALRARLTDAERKLWFALCDRRFKVLKFRRQVLVGPFIADFLCYDLRLIIEVDGGQHTESTSDERRDRWFAQNDFRVLRFWNHDVLSSCEGVLTAIQAAVTPHPAPRLRSASPSPARGEGKETERGERLHST